MNTTAIDVIRAWWVAAHPTPEQSALAQKRLNICKGCDSMVDSVVFDKKCAECGCPIGKKIFTDKMGTCDLHKWDKVEGL
jgi:hypothetical protein